MRCAGRPCIRSGSMERTGFAIQYSSPLEPRSKSDPSQPTRRYPGWCASKTKGLAEANLLTLVIAGLAYAEGVGTPRNDELAYKWMRRATNQGFAAAMVMVANYWGWRINKADPYEVPEQVIRKYVWLSLAEASGKAEAKKELDRISDALPNEERQWAQRQATSWRVCSDLHVCQDKEIDVGPFSRELVIQRDLEKLLSRR